MNNSPTVSEEGIACLSRKKTSDHDVVIDSESVKNEVLVKKNAVEGNKNNIEIPLKQSKTKSGLQMRQVNLLL